MSWIFAIFVLLPLAELVLLLKVGAWLGLWRTVSIIVMTAIVGAWMWRQQGLSILWAIQDRLSQNEMPAGELLEGVMILVGGAFFLTPGFITDAIGFLCLIPLTRRRLRDFFETWLRRKIENGEIEVYVSGGPFE